MSARYIIITLEDAKRIAVFLRASLFSDTRRLIERFEREEGADIEDIVARLKGSEICAACAIEGQASYCTALESQKQGRRLRRLLERARGERPEGT